MGTWLKILCKSNLLKYNGLERMGMLNKNNSVAPKKELSKVMDPDTVDQVKW